LEERIEQGRLADWCGNSRISGTKKHTPQMNELRTNHALIFKQNVDLITCISRSSHGKLVACMQNSKMRNILPSREAVIMPNDSGNQQGIERTVGKPDDASLELGLEAHGASGRGAGRMPVRGDEGGARGEGAALEQHLGRA
jgi:hypothetical protein